jgi:FKBP-type peptidyl-prolyl cis-trans isomerase FkpA
MTRHAAPLASAVAVAVLALAPLPGQAAGEPKTEQDKTLYAVGLAVSRELTVFQLSPAELEVVKKGIADGASGKKPAVDLDAYQPKIQELARTRREATSAKLATVTQTAVDKALAEKGAVKTESGLVFVPLKEGKGASPAATDTVRVHYRGTFADGKEFDSSLKRGPAEFALNQVIKCLTEGVQKLKVGGKARLVCPYPIAYGEGGRPGIPPKATLFFEVELLDIVKK